MASSIHEDLIKQREITLGEIAQGSPESLLYVLARQIDAPLTGARRLAVVAELRRLADAAEASPDHAVAIKSYAELREELGHPLPA